MERCKASIVFGDGHGDNDTTFHCQLDIGHEGKHEETGDMGYGIIKLPYSLTWEGSEEELEST